MLDTLQSILFASINPAIYLIYQLPAVLAAWLLAYRVKPRTWLEQFSAAGFIYSLEMIAIPGVLGLCGVLSSNSLLIAAYACGATVMALERKRPRAELPPLNLSLPEILLAAAGIGMVAYHWLIFCYLPSIGTDSLTYHLFFPAVWLKTGVIERISQSGLMTASYPCYGELLYAWNLAPVMGDFFAKNVQFYHLLLSAVTVVAAGCAVGFRRIQAIAAAVILIYSGVVFRNASVALTDLMTGANLLCGIAFLGIAARRNATAFFLLSGIAFGVAAATKYLGLLLAPPALLLLGAVIWFRQRRCRKNLLLASAAAVVIASPCLIANWIAAGNPVYPLHISLGNWTLFNRYMTVPAPAAGWTANAWHFFVNDGRNNLELANAIVLLAALAAAWAAIIGGRTLSRFRNEAMLALGVVTLLLLLLQLKIYPMITQPRQIVPLAMLAAMLSMELFRRWDRLCGWRNGWLAAMVLTLAVGGSLRATDYPQHGMGILLWAALSVLFLWTSFRLVPPRRRWIPCSLAALFLLLNVGYRYGVANAASEKLYRAFVSAEDAVARESIESLVGAEPAIIAYTGLHYYFYLGPDYKNRVLSIPVSASGKANNWDYPDWASMRSPGTYTAYLERLRQAHVRFLVCDTRTFDAPNPRLEIEWAQSHPEHFRNLIAANGFYLFERLPATEP